MSKNTTHSAADLVAMIRGKYSGNAYVVLEEVADGTGAYAQSWIDAAVFSLWPSKGLWRAACEVKVSRQDFLSELSSPEKNQWAREHFDFFWYVVAPGVAKEDEIPAGTGMMTVRGNGLSITKHAPRRDDVKTDASIIASFARSLDKERERFRRDGIREALENDQDYQRAKFWQEGAERYIKSCDEYCHPSSPDEVYEKLLHVAREKSPDAVAADHSLRVLGKFQADLVNFLHDIAPLAAHLLNARDETGRFIIDAYGGKDEKTMDALRAMLKTRKGRKQSWCSEADKIELETRELLSQ